jgi:hypothetical protein
MTIIFDGTQGITTPAETANNSVTTPVVKSGSALTLQTNGSTTAVTIDTSQRVGIGITNPTNFLDVNTSISITENSVASANTDLTFYSRFSDNQRGYVTLKAESNSSGSSDLVVRSRNNFSEAEKFRIDSVGRVTMPAQPCFLATRTSGSMTTNGQTVVFNSVQFNTGSHYNSTNGRFTAPIAGNYLFALSAITGIGSGDQSYLNLYKNNAFYGLSIYAGGQTTYYKNFSSSFILNLAAGDYIELVVGTNTNLYAAGDGGNPRFSGCLLN